MDVAGVGIDWTFASLDDSSGSTFAGFLARSVAVLISLGGLCVTALMLGIVSDQIGQMIEGLKKGKSEVGELPARFDWIGSGCHFHVEQTHSTSASFS